MKIILSAKNFTSLDNKEGKVFGMAFPYDTVGYPAVSSGKSIPVAIAPGAAKSAFISALKDEEDDITLVKGHDPLAVFASVYNKTLTFEEVENGVNYEAQVLDEDIPESVSFYGRIKKRYYRDSSIGFGVVDAESKKMEDNSIKGDGKTKKVLYVGEMRPLHLGILPNGAFKGASAMASLTEHAEFLSMKDIESLLDVEIKEKKKEKGLSFKQAYQELKEVGLYV